MLFGKYSKKFILIFHNFTVHNCPTIMKKILLLALPLLVFSAACSNLKKINVAEVDTLFFDHNPSAPNNFGSEISGEVIARMRSGKEIDITKNNKLEIESNDLTQRDYSNFNGSQTFVITKKPTNFNDNFAIIKLTLTDKEGRF